MMIKIRNSKFEIRNCQRGMTYVELIVVLSIFATMTSVVLFNYGDFQAKVDMKNLASDIGLKIVEAQKSSVSGKLPPQAMPSTWKPSYGVYFNSSSAPDSSDNNISFNKKFIYFVDLNNATGYEAGEALNTIYITKGNYISRIDRCTGVDCVPSASITPLSITFKRTDSGAVFKDLFGETFTNDYIKIIIASPQSDTITASIRIYPSGRIQVN